MNENMNIQIHSWPTRRFMTWSKYKRIFTLLRSESESVLCFVNCSLYILLYLVHLLLRITIYFRSANIWRSYFVQGHMTLGIQYFYVNVLFVLYCLYFKCELLHLTVLFGKVQIKYLCLQILYLISYVFSCHLTAQQVTLSLTE